MAERLVGEATVVAAHARGRHGQAGDGESYWWQDLGSAVFGKTTWELVIEVRSPPDPPYQVGVRTKQPNKLFGVRGFLDGARGIAPGLVLPVTIAPDDPADVEVDWRAFEQRAGAHEELKAADDAKRSRQATEAFAAELRKKPGRFEEHRAIVLRGAADLADGVRAGTHPMPDLEALLATNLPLGIITPEEAETFRRTAAPEGPG